MFTRIRRTTSDIKLAIAVCQKKTFHFALVRLAPTSRLFVRARDDLVDRWWPCCVAVVAQMAHC